MSVAATNTAKADLQSRLVVFDLDGTITYKDTFLPFVIGFFVRRPRLRLTLLWLPVSVFLYAIRRLSAGALKQRFCQAFLGGAPVDSILAWAQTFAKRVASQGCRPHILARIEEFKRQGARLILLSASPDIYVREIANELGISEVISTEVEIGMKRFSGKVIGENCKGAEKLHRLKAHLNGLSGQVSVVAFGDRTSDLPVLRWAGEGWLVRGDDCIPVERQVDAEQDNVRKFASRIRAHLSICRIDHWAKNVFVLPGAIVAYSVAHPALDTAMIWRIFLGILSVCLIASSNYVINEVLDAPFDRLHPTKHTRPAAQGRVYLPVAYVQWLALMVGGLALGWFVSSQFFAAMALLWVMGCIYNCPPVRTKDLVYLDVLSESVNNPIRLLAGWYIITETLVPPISLLISYWMVGCYFMAIKRFSEYREIGNRDVASAYRPSFGFYSDISLLVSIVFYASTAMLFFGAFIIRYRMELVLSFPLIALVMAIYLQIAFKPGSSVQNPEFLYKEPALMVAVLLCAFVMVSLLYYKLPLMYKIFAPTLPTATGLG
jgi:HAD superfamily hydrolase (TIGR01490 family)